MGLFKECFGINKELTPAVNCLALSNLEVQIQSSYRLVIAYSEQCRIRDLQRRECHFWTKDMASVMQSFMWQKFY